MKDIQLPVTREIINQSIERSEEIFTKEKISRQFRKGKNGRAVPFGVPHKESWQLLMDGSLKCSDKITNMWKKIYITKNYPGTFRESEGCQLPKHNHKEKCKAVRVINKLCPAGKTFTNLIWSKANKIKRHYAFGFTEGRRREQAILVANTIKWRLRKLGINFTQSMHDVANAFPSMSHEALNHMIENRCHLCDQEFIKTRHTNSSVCIETPTNERIYVNPRQGGLQGDGAMAPEFGQVYEEALEKWMVNENNSINVTDPITNETIHAGSQNYADDISDINMFKDCQEFINNTNSRNQALDSILELMEMGQNVDKEEHLIFTCGRNAVKRAQDIHESADRIRRHQSFGVTKCSGKYLGNFTHTTGKTNENTDNRVKAMRESFYAFKNLWNNKDIHIKNRVRLFQGNIISAATSGLEAEVIGITEMNKLESTMCALLRKVLHDDANKFDKETNKWSSINNNDLRKKANLPTIKSTIEKRKLQWLQNMIREKDDNVLIRAALTGDMEIDREGITNFTPWMEEMCHILTKAITRNNSSLNIAQKITQHGNLQWIWTCYEILTLDAGKLLQWEDNDDENTEDNHYVQSIGMPKGINEFQSVNQYVISNVCPLCRKVAACNRTNKKHVQLLWKNHREKGNNHCITKNMKIEKEYVDSTPKKWECPSCRITINGREKILDHCKTHLREIIFGEEIGQVTEESKKKFITEQFKRSQSPIVKGNVQVGGSSSSRDHCINQFNNHGCSNDQSITNQKSLSSSSNRQERQSRSVLDMLTNH
jgi:hypothetical protein